MATLLTVSVVAALAGCAASPPPPTTPTPTTGSASTTPEPVRVPGLDTPLLLPAARGPDSPVKSFAWRVPPGAIRDTPVSGSGSLREIWLQVMPDPEAGGAVDQYALLVVARSDGRSVVVWQDADGPLGGVRALNLSSPAVVDVSPRFDGRLAAVDARTIEEGDTLHIVVAARAAEAGPLPVFVRAVPDRPGAPTAPPASVDEVLQGAEPAVVQPSAAGAGLRRAFYSLVNVAVPPQTLHEEFRSADLTLTERERSPTEPLAANRDFTLAASSGAGYGRLQAFALVGSVAACPGFGAYELHADLHGVPVAAKGTLVPGVPEDVAPSFSVDAYGDGEGPSSTALDLRLVHACTFELVTFIQTDLGATLGQLTGTPGAARVEVSRGLPAPP